MSQQINQKHSQHQNHAKKRIVIIGGVAGGASAAARARRLSEDATITLIEKGPFVSFANCGLPYHVGGVIEDRAKLLVQTPKSLKARFNIDVHVETEAIEIKRQEKQVIVKDLKSGKESAIPYDELILSTGAESFRPTIPGIDSPFVFTLQTIPEMDRLMSWIKEKNPKHATVIGGGFIGLETAENLAHKGIAVTIVEMGDQLFAPVDLEMAQLIHRKFRAHHIDLKLKTQLTAIETVQGQSHVSFSTGEKLKTDLVVMAIGVRPRTALAEKAGLQLGARKGVQVNSKMQTSDPHIFAVGDMVEVMNPLTKESGLVPLAGPANRQGRIAADVIFGKDVEYRGTIGTSICKLFNLTAATTGANQKTLKRLQIPHESITLHPSNHATYYPGAEQMVLKLIFAKNDGKILGAQIIGHHGVDKRIDVLSTAIQAGMTIHDLENLELAYAPPYSSAKDPVNFAGFVAANVASGDHRMIHAEEVELLLKQGAQMIDVRTANEFEQGTLPTAKNISVDHLRERMSELDPKKKIIVHCRVGLRGYVAQRILTQHGFDCVNLDGGYLSWQMYQESIGTKLATV
jgi:NADPH-dependent 2,4-dienoyl-CoA reductase/sulfur reductase-like enzyme/rhodanese-related sulfurtransferase